MTARSLLISSMVRIAVIANAAAANHMKAVKAFASLHLCSMCPEPPPFVISLNLKNPYHLISKGLPKAAFVRYLTWLEQFLPSRRAANAIPEHRKKIVVRASSVRIATLLLIELMKDAGRR